MLRFITVAGLLALTLTAVAVSGLAKDLISQTSAVTAEPEHGRILFLMHCAACHGRHAWGDDLREIPALAGQRETYLIQQLAHFVTGNRPGSEMHGPVMHDTLQPSDVDRAQAFRDLAAYLSREPRNPHADTGDARALSLGERNYARGCAGCHGREGAGREAAAIPTIGGQGYHYLRTQLHNFASGRLPHPGLADSPVALSAEEQDAVADYVSRLSGREADGAH
jgi:cytochrome c553